MDHHTQLDPRGVANAPIERVLELDHLLLHTPANLARMTAEERAQHRAATERAIAALAVQIERLDRVDAGELPIKPRETDGIEDRFIRETGIMVELDEVDACTDIECGFRACMFTATTTLENGDEIKISADSGGGYGSPWVTISAGDRHFRLDAREAARGIITMLTAESRIGS